MPPPDAPRLITFGRLGLVDACGFDILSPESSKLLALLAYLAAAPKRRATREHLIDLFWSDSTVPKARNALRQSLHKLREALGPGLLPAGTGADVVLGAELTTDRDRFLAALDSGDYECAIALHSGPFAPGILSAGSADFEQWADQERARLQDKFAAAIEVVARRNLDAGHPAHVRVLANRLLAIDPSDERAWRLRIEAEAASGSRVHLAASIAEIERRFAQENRTIKPQTRQLIQALSRPAATEEPDSAGPGLIADLVGRHEEFARLYEAWRHAGSRRPSHLHLIGPAGLGKTRLLEDFAVRLRGERGRVMLARATPRQRALPGSFLATLIAALADVPGARGITPRSARILVELQPAVEGRFGAPAAPEQPDGADRQLMRSTALADLLKALADEGPTCLLLDDLHWWDQHSRDVVADAIDRLAECPMLVVTAARPGSTELSTSISSERITLKPLAVDQIEAMLASLGESDDRLAMQRLARALHQAADGVPLLILEALRLGLDRSALVLDAGNWDFPRLDDFIGSLRPGAALRERIAALVPTQRELLLLAAVMEQPIAEADATALGVDGAAVALIGLERLGMLASQGNGWVTAHDLIAEVVIEAAARDDRRRARSSAGELMLRTADSQAEFREAARQFAAADDPPAIARCGAAWIQRRRADGDHRSGNAIAQELLRVAVDAPVVGAAIALLPPPLRRRPVRTGLVAAVAATLVLAVTAAWWAWPAPTRADATIAFFVGSPDSAQQLAVPLALSSWSRTRSPLRASPAAHFAGHFPGRRRDMASTPMPAPDGHGWLVARIDSGRFGPSELDMVAPSGAERALSPAPGDDANPAWSPDSRHAVFSTTRWTVRANATFQLGVVDIADGSVRQLTNGAASDQEPKWSPDGTRIAFRRSPAELAPDELCWISTDGAREHCRSFEQGVRHIVGWTDQQTILAVFGVGSDGMLAEVDPDGSRVTPILRGGANNLLLSPAGDWLFCECVVPEAPDTAVAMAFPAHQPESRREILGVANAIWMIPFWFAGASRPALATIRIVRPHDSIPLDGSYRLAVVGRSTRGTRMDPVPQVLSWHIGDSSVAGADSLTGDLYPRRRGSTWVSVSAGGWLKDSTLISIRGPVAMVLLSEAWTDSWRDRWIAGGPAPAPSVVESRAIGRGFTPNGNGTYSDTAVTRMDFPSDAGLGVEAILQTPVTRNKWQNIGLTLQDVAAATSGAGIGCGTHYPSGEGWASLHFLGVPGGDTRVADSLAGGKPFRLRVQLFPDGSCGVAIDGHPVSRQAGALPVGHRMAILLRGQSVGTHMMIGPLTVWRGVRGGVDWSALDHDTLGHQPAEHERR